MKSKTRSGIAKKKDYSKYPFMNLSLESMEGEEWKDIPQFDGYYSVSNYGRIWAASRPINSVTGQIYYTKERMRKPSMSKLYNSYCDEPMEQLSIHLRYEKKSYTFRINRLVYDFFVGRLDSDKDHLLVVHKDGDNCNNRYDNLVLMNGTELYGHGLAISRMPRSGRINNRTNNYSSIKNSPRRIIQYTLDGKKLNEYESLEAAARANKVTRTSIRIVAQQKLVQLHGLVYRYEETPYNGEHAGFSYEKTVTQYALNGKKIKSYPSVKEAAQQIGGDVNAISKCALKKLRTYLCFVWRYKGDDYDGTYEDKNKSKPLPVTQYSLEGKKVATFGNVNEASRLTGFSATNILDCAHKRSKVANGYVWRFKNEPYGGGDKEYQRGKPVTQYTREGKRINTYATMAAAALATGLTSDNIQKNVHGHNKTAGGFIWKFATLKEMHNLPPVLPQKQKNYGSRKEVIRYSPDGKEEKAFTSITEAAKVCNIPATGISAVLNKPGRMAAGFVWRTKGNKYTGSDTQKLPTNKARTVTQYDMNGGKLNVYRSTYEAEKTTGVSSSTISSVARGKLKSTGGFIWLYGDGPVQINIETYFGYGKAFRRNSKPVLKYSLTGEFLKEYPSIQAAGREEGITASSISSAVNGLRKSAGGNLWRLKDSDSLI